MTSKTKVVATLTDKGLSLVINGEPTTINNSHRNYNKILDALIAKDYDKIPSLLHVAQTLVDYSSGLVEVRHGVVYFKGTELHNSITDNILKMQQMGLENKHLIMFLSRLMNNPSHRSVEQLWRFREACDMPITEDGRLLCYRSVKSSYWDSHTGRSAFCKPAALMDTQEKSLYSTPQINNGVTTEIVNGYTVVSMDRNRVNDNPNETCSNGLHVCSQGYGKFSDILLLVAVDPADVVSVPTDYNNAKMRVSKFTVLKVVEAFQKFDDTPVYEDEEIEWEIFEDAFNVVTSCMMDPFGTTEIDDDEEEDNEDFDPLEYWGF